MKLTLMSSAGLVLSMALITSVGYARIPSQTTTRQTQTSTQTYIGHITMMSSDRAPVPYIFYDRQRRTNYFVDENDNDKVARYDERDVEITGTLDRAHKTIHVQSIKELN
jgi:hypothetical protein